MQYIIVGSDFTHELRGVRDGATGSYLNSATITFQIYTAADGVAVSGASGSLSYVAASDGIYRGVTESTVTSTLTANTLYYAEYTISQSSYDDKTRLYITAKPPGGGIIDAMRWADMTGLTLSSAAEEIACESTCAAVSEALTQKAYPVLIEPRAITLFPMDAPVSNSLFLPRPIRSISAIHLIPNASGDSSQASADNLLTNFVDYYSPPTDVLTGWNKTGIVYRRGSSIWGVEYRRGLGMLSATADPNRGALFVSAALGPLVVSSAVREAAKIAVTLIYNSREFGALVQSNSWNGGSFSLAGSATLDGSINNVEVRNLMMSVGAAPIHVG